ncbi:MAG: hypothetical protein K2F63_07150, partial [Muribaculaceae bacterium]|nr:hypothetical protein [Muribaculaceae bacterium]
MNPDILTVIALVLAALGVGSLFVRRMPSAIASYASLVCAHLAGAAAASVRQLVFWGFATIIVMALRMAHSRDAAFSTSSCRYV